MAVARGIGVPHEIDGIGEAGRRRQHGREPPAHGRVERVDRESRLPRRVGRDDAEPSPIGHDEEPAAARQGLAHQAAREIEELLDGARAQRARLLDRRVERLIGAGEGAGVRGDGAGALGGAPGLQQHDGLDRRRRAQRLEEAPPVRHALDIGGDDPRLRVSGDGLEHVRLGEVGLIAEAREEREAHAALARPVEDGDGERAGVRDERDASRLRHAGSERDVETARRPDPPEAVGAEDADGLVAEPLAELGLPLPPVLTAFPEAGGDHDGAAHALGHAVLERGENSGGGHGDHGEVDRAVDGLERGRGRESLDRRRADVHRHDAAGEARRAQVGEHAAPDLGGIPGGADHRDAVRVEKRGERSAGHAPILPERVCEVKPAP